MGSPTVYFPFLPFLETQDCEHVVGLKPKGTADNVGVEFRMAVSKALYCKPCKPLLSLV